MGDFFMFAVQKILSLGLGFAMAALVVSAEEIKAPKTTKLVAGKVLFADPLNTAFDGSWKIAKGKWELSDGAIKGAELKSDMHGAVARHDVAFKDGIIEFSFRLDGAKSISLSLNASKGHICRLAVRPTGFSVVKDAQDKKAGDRSAVLGTCDTTIKPGEWHTLVLELAGDEMIATMDGKHKASGSNPAVNKEKANLGFTIAGETASFKGLKVWAVK